MIFCHSLWLLLAVSLVSSSWARLLQRRARHGHRRDFSGLVNRTVPWGDDPEELVKRDGSKYVFMHHIVGNTYPYTAQDWENDIKEIQAKGVDALALNIGSSDWQKDRIATAYDVAKNLGTGLKLFISFDLTEMACDLNDIVSRVRTFSDHPNQFKINGKVFISSYAGDCLGNDGWASLKSQTNGYIMPFIWGLEGRFSQWPALDSWYCWGCAWPQSNVDKSTADDEYYYSQLGSKYATTVSMWMFTHLASKNFYLRGDGWLLNSRWEQLFAMRDRLTFVEMVTWNDYGESDYFGPVRGAQPAGTYWADGYPHTAWFDMSEYYIKAFKTGSYPAITEDVIYYWSRPHPAKATASADSLGPPTGYDWALDYMWVAMFATSPASVTLKMGTSSQTFSVTAGVSKLKIPTAEGKITVQMARNGQTIIDDTPNDFTFVNNPVRYNYNAYVGAATATAGGTPTSSTSASSTSSSSSATSPATTAPTPTSTTVNGVTWTYRGCYPDISTSRTLYDGTFVSDTSNSISKCLASCSAQGYAFGGVEYGKECFCGTVIRNGVAPVSEGDCSQPCAGNANEVCGNGGRINIYSRPLPTTTTTATPSPTSTSVGGSTWTYRGCYSDSQTSRILYDGTFVSDNANSVSKCLSTCSAQGYAYGGVEYGKECFCGTVIRAGASLVAEAECNQACAGNANEKCGAGNRINVYSRTLPTFTSATSTGTTVTASSTTAIPGPTTTGFVHKGCVAEGTTGTRRALTGASYSRTDMTPQVCQSLCSGYQFAGVEYGLQCYCGNTITNNGATGALIADSNCASTCSGDASQKCGGGWTLDLYQKATTVWKGQGCYIDSSDRMLRGYYTSQSSMTTEKCVGICSGRGFAMAGTQYGKECYCGNQIYKTGAAGSPTSASECNMSCDGNASQTCGAGWRTTLWTT